MFGRNFCHLQLKLQSTELNISLTHSSSSSRLGHKLATKLRHTDLSRALTCASPHVRPISSSSFITVLSQVVFDLPLSLLPDGVHLMATLGILFSGILST